MAPRPRWGGRGGEDDETMKARWKNLVAVGVTFALVVLVALLGIFGMNIGDTKYRFMSLGEAIPLGLDLGGGTAAVYRGDSAAENFDALMDDIVSIFRQRLADEGYAEAAVTRLGDDSIRVEIPGVDDPAELLAFISAPAHLEFLDPEGNVVIGNKDVVKATAVTNQSNGNPMIQLELTDEGALAFAEATAANVGKAISFMMDGAQISAPTVEQPITGGVVYISQADVETALKLAGIINSGELPLTLEQVEVHAVTASLGEDAYDRLVLSAAIGLALVLIALVAVYRLPGAMGALVLGVYMLAVGYALALIPGIRLTLSSVAGLLVGVVLLLGGFVCVFQRFREEVRQGRSLSAAADRGYRAAQSSMLSSNLLIFFVGLVLVSFGSGSVKGFAATATISALIALVCNLILTRIFFKLSVKLAVRDRGCYVRPFKAVQNDARRVRGVRLPLLIALVVVLVAAGLTALGAGLRTDYAFSGGDLITYDMGESFRMDDVRAALKAADIRDFRTLKADGTQLQIFAAELGENAEAARAAFEENLAAKYPNLAYGDTRHLGPSAALDQFRGALEACLIALACMLVFSALRYRPTASLAALFALIHDGLIVCAVMGLIGFLVPVGLSFAAAILATLAFSTDQTVALFERVREKRKGTGRDRLPEELADDCAREAAPRAVHTAAAALLFLLPALVLGTDAMRAFFLPLLLGALVAAYTASRVSARLWAAWSDCAAFKRVGNIFRRKGSRTDYTRRTQKTKS